MSICSNCLILLIAELDDLTISQAHVRNAYLEAYSNERFILSPDDNLLVSEWKVMYLFCPRYHMDYEQVANNTMRLLQTHFVLKNSHYATPILMYGCDTQVKFMNM